MPLATAVIDINDAPVKISARGIGRVFGVGRTKVDALGPLDLDVRDGEFLCLVGPSGCGKSTLLRILAGLAPPSEGRIDVHTPDGGAPKLAMGRFAKAYPATLSGGMRQRVSIARALATDPDILLMDEPFAALDAQLRTLLQEELLTLCQETQRTVLFVTHSLEEALLLGDRVAVLSNRPGRLLEIVDVPFERPRSPEIRASAAFADLQQTLWGHLRQEVRQTLESEETS